MNEKPHIITVGKLPKTKVSLPDKDGDVRLEFDSETSLCYLSKADVEAILARFNP